jgi:hypothetical protein
MIKDDDTKKKFNAPLESRFQIYSSRLCQSLYDVKQKSQMELCTPSPITVRGGDRCNFKGLSQEGGQAKLAENLRASPFDKELSNKISFS